MGRFLFLTEFLKHWREVGAMAPASLSVQERLLAPHDFTPARRVVELGGGVGSITRPLLARLSEESRLYVFEINRRFCDELRKIPDQRLVVLERSAEELYPGLIGGSADYIISSVPLSNCGAASRLKVLAAARRTLSLGGVFIQYQYSPAVYPLFRRMFGEVTVEFELKNAPPVFIFRCREPLRAA